MLHYFILNPVAGHIDETICTEVIETVCKEKKAEYEIAVSRVPGEVVKLAADAAQRGIEYIYAIGGDGTLNEAANGILSAENSEASALIPVPCGTGNDFVKSIDSKGFYKDSISALNQAAKGSEEYKTAFRTLLISMLDRVAVKKIDVGMANKRYFLNIASVGFDADVVINAAKYKAKKYIPNGLAYYVSVFTTFITNKPKKVICKLDDEPGFEQEITLAAAANGKYYGGGIKPVPSAELDDGIMDVLVVDGVKRLTILKFFPKYSKGKHVGLKFAHFHKCKKFSIECPEGIVLNVDGETMTEKSVLFRLLAAKMSLGIVG